MGAPVGSVIVGSNDFIKKAIRVRKALGKSFMSIYYLVYNWQPFCTKEGGGLSVVVADYYAICRVLPPSVPVVVVVAAVLLLLLPLLFN